MKPTRRNVLGSIMAFLLAPLTWLNCKRAVGGVVIPKEIAGPLMDHNWGKINPVQLEKTLKFLRCKPETIVTYCAWEDRIRIAGNLVKNRHIRSVDISASGPAPYQVARLEIEFVAQQVQSDSGESSCQNLPT